jgi:DNA processing protein
VEGAVRSGALNTAHWATNLHRPLMGVPGPVTSAASVGVHQLIRLGRAIMVTQAKEVLADLAAYDAAAASAQVDESYLPGPVLGPHASISGTAIPARTAPRRGDR